MIEKVCEESRLPNKKDKRSQESWIISKNWDRRTYHALEQKKPGREDENDERCEMGEESGH
jgi:hypothetical protein